MTIVSNLKSKILKIKHECIAHISGVKLTTIIITDNKFFFMIKEQKVQNTFCVDTRNGDKFISEEAI